MEQKILVVDDVKTNIQVLGTALGKEGYAVSYATSGARALAMAAAEPFALILLDIMMPEMDGFEVCRRLKAAPETAATPILFLTARSEMEDIVQGLRLGAVDYLTKPFNTDELVARVRTHMALGEARATIARRNAELEEKNRRLEEMLEEIQAAQAEIKVLRGILPICAKCKKIKDGEGYWTQLEAYITVHSEAEFTHSLCAACTQEMYPFLDQKK